MSTLIKGGARKGPVLADVLKEKLDDSRSATCQTCGSTWTHAWSLGTALNHAQRTPGHRVLCTVAYSYLVSSEPSDHDDDE